MNGIILLSVSLNIYMKKGGGFMKKSLLKKVVAIVLICTFILGIGIETRTNVVAGETPVDEQIGIMQGNCGKSAMWEFDSNTGILTIRGTGEVTLPDLGNLQNAAKTLIIKKGIMSIGEGAFSNYRISKLEIEEGVQRIEKDAFWSCDNLSKVVIPKSVTYIGYNSFYECDSLKKFTILGDVKLGGNPFCCMAPETLRLAGKCDNLGQMFFSEESSVSKIKLINGNKNYIKKNGMLLTKDKKTLVLYYGKKNTLKVPATVTKIDNYACCSNYINKLVLNKKTKIIGKYAFDRSGLTSLTINKNLKKIKEGAFYGNNIQKIKFNKKIKYIGKSAFDDNNFDSVKLYNHPIIKKEAFGSAKIKYVKKNKK